MINILEEKVEDLLDLNKSNREQRLAIFLDRHSFISANAGSGKTSVLIKKYIYELIKNENIDNNPENIVAITFTKKAASEMLKRVYESFEKILEEDKFAEWGFSRYEFEKIYRNLSKARISTIHSFCVEIIKDYPLEAGLIPGFREINSDDINDECEEINNGYLKTVFKNEDDKYKDENELIERLELYKFRTLISNILKKHNRFNKMKDIINKDNYISEIKKIYEEYLIYQLELCINEIELMLLEMNNFTEDLDKNYTQQLSEFNNKFLKIKLQFENNEFEEINLVSVNYGRPYFLNKVDKFLEARGYKFKIEKHAEFLKKLQNKFNDFYNSDDNNFIQQIKDIKLFIKIAQEIDKLIEEYKIENNLIDFDNILYFANKLLDNETICKKVRSGIKLLMVDEFQDTSDVQYEIVRKIVGDGDLNEIKLLIVGDEKQSIYAFRDAEIGVFKESKVLVKELNESLIFKGKIKSEFRQGDIIAQNEEKYGVVSLLTTYRLLPHLVAFINETSRLSFTYLDNYKYNYFKNIMKSNVTHYNDFVYGIKDNIKPDNPSIIEKINSNPIEFLYYLKEYDEDNYQYFASEDNSNYDEVKNIEEVKMIAIRIKELLDSGHSAGEIGVLSVKSNDFNNLSIELDKYNIPNVVHGHKKYYLSREIKDVYCYLRFLIEPDYDLNLAALLKSYFFAFSDSEILELSIMGEKISLLEKLKLASDQDKAKYKTVYNYLISALNNYVVYDINGLINYLRLNSFWYKSLNVLQINDEVEDNINLLISSLEDFLENKSNNFSDMIDYITSKINDEKDKREKEDVLIQSDKVNILTIHSSKGLEFDIVIIMNMFNQLQITSKVEEYSNNYSFVFKPNIDKRRNVDTPLSKLFSIEKNIIEYSEKIRLLYVGMTRARNKLIFTNQINFNKNGSISTRDTFSNYIIGYLTDKLNYENYTESMVEFEFNDNIYAQDLGTTKQEYDIKYKIIKKYYRLNDLNFTSAMELRDDYENPKKYLDKKIPIKITKEDFTATKFKNINAYESEYFKKYILKVPEELLSKDYDFTDFDGNKIVNSAAKGNVIHFLMENQYRWLTFELNVRHDRLEDLIIEGKKIYNIDADINSELFRICNNFANSYYLKKYDKFLSEFIFELAIKMPLGKSYLSCKIDLCFMNGDTLEIWDWKTDKIEDDVDIEKKNKLYIHQLETYVVVAYYYFNKPKKIKAKLLYLDYLVDYDNSDRWVSEFEFTDKDIPKIVDNLKKSLIKTNKMNYGIV